MENMREPKELDGLTAAGEAVHHESRVFPWALPILITRNELTKRLLGIG